MLDKFSESDCVNLKETGKYTRATFHWQHGDGELKKPKHNQCLLPWNKVADVVTKPNAALIHII